MDNTLDVTDRLTNSAETGLAEMTPVLFEADRVETRIIIGVRVGGRKVQEIPLAISLCYPFDLGAVLPQACEQARKQWEQQQNAS